MHHVAVEQAVRIQLRPLIGSEQRMNLGEFSGADDGQAAFKVTDRLGDRENICWFGSIRDDCVVQRGVSGLQLREQRLALRDDVGMRGLQSQLLRRRQIEDSIGAAARSPTSARPVRSGLSAGGRDGGEQRHRAARHQPALNTICFHVYELFLF